MGTLREKIDIIEWIVRQDDPAVLKKIIDTIEAWEAEMFSNAKVIGQKPNGTRVSRTELVQSFDEAIAQFRKGMVISLEDFESASETW
jgi:glutaredoxin 2